MKELFIRQNGTHILYDGDAAPRFSPDWFDLDALRRAGAVERETRSGRAPAVFFSAQGDALVLKHYRRGGLPGRFVRDAYFGVKEGAVRSFREWRLLAELQRLKLPAPRPCAARYRRCGISKMYYTADLITFRIPGTRPLSQALARGNNQSDHDAGRPPSEQWRAIGATIRRFHDAGVHHADLNAHNVLLGESAAEVFLVDFDKARVITADDARLQANLKRLRRSLDKLRTQSPGFAYEDEDFARLLSGYHE